MAEDLTVFFQDDLITVSVTFNGVDTRGILDEPDSFIANNTVESTDYTLLIPTGAFTSAPKFGDTITVDGDIYTVNTNAKIDDGKLSRLGLSKT
jgi:hypothetical protein